MCVCRNIFRCLLVESQVAAAGWVAPSCSVQWAVGVRGASQPFPALRENFAAPTLLGQVPPQNENHCASTRDPRPKVDEQSLALL